jgi:hypothetical protein
VGRGEPEAQDLPAEGPGGAGGADIALVEVANAVDLSGVTFFGIAIGS